MVLHAFATSTSRICLRLMRFKLDFEPSVATSLRFCQRWEGVIESMLCSPHSRDAIFAGCENCKG